MQAEAAKLHEQADQLEDDLRETRMRLEYIRAGIVGVQAYLQLDQDVSSDVAVGQGDASTASVAVQEPVFSTPAPVPPATGRKRFRSTQFVADLLAEDPRVWSFEEVVAAFDKAGASAGMKNPEGAIRTALLRAVEKHGVVMVDVDHYQAMAGARQEGA